MVVVLWNKSLLSNSVFGRLITKPSIQPPCKTYKRYDYSETTAAGDTFKTPLMISIENYSLETIIAMIEVNKIDRCNNNCDYSQLQVLNIDMITTRNISFNNYNGLEYFAYYFKNSINDIKDQCLKVFLSLFRRLLKQKRMNSDHDSKGYNCSNINCEKIACNTFGSLMNMINNDFEAACSNLQSYTCLCFDFAKNTCTNIMELILIVRSLLIFFVAFTFILFCNTIFGYYVHVYTSSHPPTMCVQLN